MTKDKWKYMLVEFVMFNICGVSFYNDYLRFWRRKNGLPYKNIGGSLNVLQQAYIRRFNALYTMLVPQ